MYIKIKSSIHVHNTFIVLCIIVCYVAGCQCEQRPVEVHINHINIFPEYLVGRWIDDGKSDWEFVVEPNGEISSAVISMGRLDMVPGQIREFPTKYGGHGVFKPGVWMVFFNAETKELRIDVVIEHFYQDMGEDAIEGNFTDTLVGPVSENGDIWQAEWFRCETLISHNPEPKVFSHVECEEATFIKKLIFTKVKTIPSK